MGTGWRGCRQEADFAVVCLPGEGWLRLSALLVKAGFGAQLETDSRDGTAYTPAPLVIGITERHLRSLLRLGVHPCILFPQIKSLMFRHDTREKVLAKLITARCELEDALNATQVARYDLLVLPEPIRIKLASMIDDLNGVVSQLEGTK